MTLASSAAPPRALKIWASGSDIYIEIPGHNGKAPYITRYNYDSRGVHLLLELIGAHRCDYDYIDTVPNDYRSNFNTGPGDAVQQASADRALLALKAILRK
jgi:hypothetical protein